MFSADKISGGTDRDRLGEWWLHVGCGEAEEGMKGEKREAEECVQQ